MRILGTILTATAICAAMLAAGIHDAGDLPVPEASTGLTTAFILGTDGMAPGEPHRTDASLGKADLGKTDLDKARLGRSVVVSLRADRTAE